MGTTIEQFAGDFSLKVTRDGCGDPIIQGTRGHLYFDDDNLCLMALNARLTGFSNQQVQSLGGKCWICDIWRDERRRGYRDVKVLGIPKENWPSALRLLRVRRIPKPTAAQLAVLAEGRRPFKPGETWTDRVPTL